MSRLKLLLILISLLVGLFALASHSAIAAPQVQSGELLTNPGFEPFTTADGKFDYPTIITDDGGGHVAEGWGAWWYNDAGVDYSVPEFDIAPIYRDEGFRVHSGNAAQHIFRPTVLWMAGVYQQVNVPTNSNLRFTIWGHTWAGFCKQIITKENGEEKISHDCGDNHDSFYGEGANPTTMRVGIDPTGGTDWSSSNIVWSQDYAIYDHFSQLAVEAAAQGNKVTVFTFTTFQYPAPINNVYWDDASLVAIGASNPTPAATASGNATNQPQPTTIGGAQTQPPNADGSQHHIVKSGETLAGIARAYGVSIGSIKELNGIAGDNIQAGQDLLIKEAPPATATPIPTQEPTTEPTQEVAEVPAVEQTAKICLSLFDDTNKDGLRDPSEPLLGGGVFNLTGAAANSYTTTGSNEPYCFEGLAAGDYTISTNAPSGYLLSGLAQIPISLSGGGQISLEVGVAKVEPTPVAPPVEQTAAPTGNGTRTILIVVGVVGGLLTLASAGGLAFYYTNYRRRAIE